MNKLWKYNNYLYIASRILIGIDIIYRLWSDISSLIIYFSIFLFIVVNDYLRMNYFYKYPDRYFKSIFISMIVSSILLFSIGGYSNIFMLIILYELIIFTEGKLSKRLIILQILLIFFIILFRNTSIAELLSCKFWKDNFIDIIMSFIGFTF